MKWLVGLVLIVCCSCTWAMGPDAPLSCKEITSGGAVSAGKDVSLRYLISDLRTLPGPILKALEAGAEHPAILRRGFVVQEYLPVSEENIALVFEKLSALGISLGSAEQEKAALLPGEIKEIRLLTKSIKIGNELVEVYQIALKRDGDISVELMQTPERLEPPAQSAMAKLLLELRSKVTADARKAFFELALSDSMGRPQLQADGKTPLSVEVDFILDGNRDSPRVKFLKAEVKFIDSQGLAAETQAKKWRNAKEMQPNFIQAAEDISQMTGVKTRDIARFNVPPSLAKKLEANKEYNEPILRGIVADFKKWARPDAVDLALSTSAFASDLQKVPLSKFLWNLLRTRKLHETVRLLETEYQKRDFEIKIPLWGKKVFLLKTHEAVAEVMKAKTKLTYGNRDFSVAAGLNVTINDVNVSDKLWEDLHFGLLEIFNTKKISGIMEKYKSLLDHPEKNEENYDLNLVLEEYFMRVWGEYMFGEVVFEKFREMRNQLIDTLAKAFHQGRFKGVPLMGRLASHFNAKRYEKEWKKVNDSLAELLDQAISHKQGAFYELYAQLQEKNYPNAYEIALQNSFLGVLVYDFIYLVLHDATVQIARHDQLDRRRQVARSIRSAFLYPWRGRIAEEDIGTHIKRGDFCIVNLKEANLAFSGGPRTCAGAKLFAEIHRTFLKLIADLDLKLVDPNQPTVTTGDENTPFVVNPHPVTVKKKGRCPFTGRGGSC